MVDAPDLKSGSCKAVWVRLPPVVPLIHIGGSSNGRTADFDSANLGSNPSPPAIDKLLKTNQNNFQSMPNIV